MQNNEIKNIINLFDVLQRLPILFAQVKADNISRNLLNEICQYILCIKQEKLLKGYLI